MYLEADTTGMRQRAVENSKADLDRCRMVSSTFDTYSDGCQTYKRNYESDLAAFNSQLRSMELALLVPG